MSPKTQKNTKTIIVGTTDRWNDAKRAEEHDRVKHSL